MKKFLYVSLMVCSTTSAGHILFQETDTPFNDEKVCYDTKNLVQVAKNTLDYINGLNKRTKKYVEGISTQKQANLSQTTKTLKFLSSKLKKEALTPAFLQKNFTCLKWEGKNDDAQKHGISLSPGTIRLTKYLVFETKGSTVQTDDYPHALYALPFDEKGLSRKEKEQKHEQLTRFKYTKHDVLDGVVDKNKLAKPLVWLSRHDIEEALMQGSIVVSLSDNMTKIFNVDQNNGIDYDRSLKDKKLQKRYWYFKELSDIKGYGAQGTEKISILPEAAFAGDVKNLGLGQFIAIRYQNTVTKEYEIRLGILADTGGAFADNLYQLDYFTGSFPSREAFKKHTKPLPTHVEAFILVKKE